MKTLNADWALADAKARFSELFRRTLEEGPQRVTRAGKDSIILIRAEDYEELEALKDQPTDLVEFFAQSPLAGLDLNLEREPDPEREVDL